MIALGELHQAHGERRNAESSPHELSFGHRCSNQKQNPENRLQ